MKSFQKKTKTKTKISTLVLDAHITCNELQFQNSQLHCYALT